jgi:hypothetical protein
MIALLLFAACKPSDSTSDFTTGDFQMATTGVDDACFDGGFEALFLPDGAGTTREWDDPVSIPAEDELPATYTVSLPDPFHSTEVTVTGSGDSRTVTGAENTDVEIDPDNYPGCLVDMSIDVDLTIVSADELQGTAVLHTGSWDEGSCPTVSGDPCDITIDLTGTRLN